MPEDNRTPKLKKGTGFPKLKEKSIVCTFLREDILCIDLDSKIYTLSNAMVLCKNLRSSFKCYQEHFWIFHYGGLCTIQQKKNKGVYCGSA